jgi:hypothetical protein
MFEGQSGRGSWFFKYCGWMALVSAGWTGKEQLALIHSLSDPILTAPIGRERRGDSIWTKLVKSRRVVDRYLIILKPKFGPAFMP